MLRFTLRKFRENHTGSSGVSYSLIVALVILSLWTAYQNIAESTGDNMAQLSENLGRDNGKLAKPDADNKNINDSGTPASTPSFTVKNVRAIPKISPYSHASGKADTEKKQQEEKQPTEQVANSVPGDVFRQQVSRMSIPEMRDSLHAQKKILHKQILAQIAQGKKITSLKIEISREGRTSPRPDCSAGSRSCMDYETWWKNEEEKHREITREMNKTNAKVKFLEEILQKKREQSPVSFSHTTKREEPGNRENAEPKPEKKIVTYEPPRNQVGKGNAEPKPEKKIVTYEPPRNQVGKGNAEPKPEPGHYESFRAQVSIMNVSAIRKLLHEKNLLLQKQRMARSAFERDIARLKATIQRDGAKPGSACGQFKRECVSDYAWLAYLEHSKNKESEKIEETGKKIAILESVLKEKQSLAGLLAPVQMVQKNPTPPQVTPPKKISPRSPSVGTAFTSDQKPDQPRQKPLSPFAPATNKPKPAPLPGQVVKRTPASMSPTGRFPANGNYSGNLTIDGWKASCGNVPIEVTETLYRGSDSSGRGSLDHYRLSTGNINSKTRKIDKIILSSSALKKKGTLTKLYEFYRRCAGSSEGITSADYTQRECWVAERGKSEGWLNEEGVYTLCKNTTSRRCQKLRECFSGLPAKKPFKILRQENPLYSQYTNKFPAVGVYPPGTFSIDGKALRCGNVTIRVLSQPGASWLGSAYIDQNLFHLNRAELVNSSTGGKLDVFADECSHLTYKANDYEAACGRWIIKKKNGWISERDVEQYCRDARENFHARRQYLPYKTPEEACERARACYGGTVKPVEYSLWGQ